MAKVKLSFYNTRKDALLLKVTCICWLLGKLLSWKIWTAGRLLPTVPIFEFLDHIPAIIHTILFALSLLFILMVLLKNNRYLFTGLLGVEILLCLLDQNRWLPWEYEYVFIILIFIINAGRPKQIVAAVTFILVSTYFYSGLSKLNDGFLQIVWTNMVLKHFLNIPASIYTKSWIHYSGYLAGIAELLAGLGLLFTKTQATSAKVLIAMHVFVLVLLGPFGFSGYQVLWPWNAGMILFLYLLFLRNNERVSVFEPIMIGWNKVVLVCWGILPLFSFFGYWDKNLSSNLFSANLPGVIVCVSDTAACKPLQKWCYKKDRLNLCHGQAKIDLQAWARIETNTSVYPEMRVYKAMQQKLETQYPAAGLSFVYINQGGKK